jgi:cell division protein FtsZ
MLFEVDEAVNRVRAEVDPDANILFGSALSEEMEGRVRVSVVATGIDAESFLRMGDNVQKFPLRRKPIDAEAPTAIASALARTYSEPVARGGVLQQVAELAQEFAVRADLPLPEEAAPAVLEEVDEPMNLGGVDAPLMEEFPLRAPALQEFAPQPKRRGFAGFFGRRRAEPIVAPTLETARAAGVARAAVQPAVQTPQQMAPQPAAPQTAGSRAADGRPQAQAAPEDLFAGVAEDDRFEIPAFLRRQAKMGS